MKNEEVAIFGTGCFWCSEAVFRRLEGVISTQVGYSGGHTKNPDYESVSLGNTGHAEVIKVVFAPSKISYKELLNVFWNSHDPTTPNRQGNDIGPQYRSIIIYMNEKQKEEAIKSKEKIKGAVTEIVGYDAFYPAENYHADYFEKHSAYPYCQLVIAPKLNYLKKVKLIKD